MPKLKPLQPGDKLYNHFNKLEIVTFVREQIAPGATIPTFLVRVEGDSRPHQVSREMYVRTEKQAHQRWLKDAKATIPNLVKQQKELAASIKETRAKIKEVRAKIKSL